MGKKRTRQRHTDIIYIACGMILALALTGCQYRYYPRVSFETIEGDKARAHMINAARQADKKNFSAAMAENRAARKILPEDRYGAVFQKGLLYAHPDNPERDLDKALECLEQAGIKSDPATLSGTASLVEAILKEARDVLKQSEFNEKMLEVLDNEMAFLKEQNMLLEQEQEELKREIRRLETQIRQLKEIDMGTIEKIRGTPDE